MFCGLSNPLVYFTDPILQAPTIGSMLMCLSSALVGVIIFLRKRSLLGESLSHAAYPGVVLSVLFASSFFPQAEESMAIAILIGAFMTSSLGLFTIEKLERKMKVKNDAALCFVLAVFFGVGVLIASRLQITHALWYKTTQIFLYGQAATMTDIHVWIYLGLAMLSLVSIFLLFRPIGIMIFDYGFAKSIGLPLAILESLVFILLVLAIVIGIRSVGVVLMAGMLIAPAIAARQFTHRLWMMFLLAACFGAFSGFLGNYLSVEIPQWSMGRARFSLPTGPMILLSASFLCLVALLLAPHHGLLSRLVRIARFRYLSLGENLLKYFWRRGEGACISAEEIKKWQPSHPLKRWWLVHYLLYQGWLIKKGSCYFLSADGFLYASRIIRLHRLWEAYLVYLGQGVEKVHRSAEEMEHVLTPELEKELTELLQDPRQDPHQQPIPRRKGLI